MYHCRFIFYLFLFFTFFNISLQAKDRRPNILFILTDDQGPQTLSCYGNTVCQTPNIDLLAKSGMVIERAYHMGSMSGAVCSPSRTMLMSGRTLWNLPPRGKKHLKQEEGVNPKGEILNNTLPAIFNRAGYETFRTCKSGNSYSLANAQFQIVKDKTSRNAGEEDGSQWHSRQVIEYLDKRTDQGTSKPFFIYFGFSHPHDERWGVTRLLKKYHVSNVKSPPTDINPGAPRLPFSWLPDHPFHHGHPDLRDEVRVPGVMKSRTEATVRNELGREYACIENIDIQIGLVVKKLKEMNELDNTYIFFTSDHGIAVGRHGLMGKQNLYEHSWRVPFIASGPGIKPGTRAEGNSYLLDVLPTLCDLTSLPIPETAQGKSLKPVLNGQSKTVRSVLYGAYCGGTKPGMRAVRKGDWKLIKYDVLNGEVRKTQLFNLKNNPNELLLEHHKKEVVEKTNNQPQKNQVNLAALPRYSAKLAEMESLLLKEMIRLGDPYRLWDQL